MTAFIVERAFDGVTNGMPEDKLGIRGSNSKSKLGCNRMESLSVVFHCFFVYFVIKSLTRKSTYMCTYTYL